MAFDPSAKRWHLLLKPDNSFLPAALQRITDRKAALLHYIARFPERFEALIQQLASEDARGTRAPVPGIIFHERKRAA